MEEDKLNEEKQNRENFHPMCVNHPIMKHIMIGVLIFLGAYCAFYTVADWHMKMMMNRPFEPTRNFERMAMKDMKSMENMFKADRKMMHKAANVIHFEKTKDYYKIIIDLRAFDNNENNVQVLTNGNILTIRGRSIRKSKNNEQISEFQQNYMFGENVKLSDLTKETDGNYYVVTIPIGDSEE